MARWVEQLDGFFSAVGIERASLVGNSFGGGLALAFADRWPERVDRLVLMGSVGVSFPITEGLDRVWGYEPSIENMRALLDLFAYDRTLVNDELARVRYEASIQPGFQESFSAMFPAPRQRWVDAMVTPDDEIARLPQPTLVVHGRDDQVIPLSNALHLLDVVPDVRLHVFDPLRPLDPANQARRGLQPSRWSDFLTVWRSADVNSPPSRSYFDPRSPAFVRSAGMAVGRTPGWSAPQAAHNNSEGGMSSGGVERRGGPEPPPREATRSGWSRNSRAGCGRPVQLRWDPECRSRRLSGGR
jgi:hypothetical protein